MKNNKSYGQIAYEAYCGSCGWRSKYTNSDLPQWDIVTEDTKVHWENSANAVVYKHEKDSLKKDEL